MEDAENFVKIPDESPNGFKVIETKEIPVFLKTLADSIILKALAEPEMTYELAYKLYKKLTNTEPQKHADTLMLWFMVIIRAQLTPFEREVKETMSKVSTTATTRRAVGLSSLLGHLYCHGLADMAHLDHWMSNVVVGEKNQFIRWNLMEIVKVQLKIFVEESDGNEEEISKVTKKKLYKMICEENPYDEDDLEEVQYRNQ
jgi:hypothetical protein